MNNGSSSQNNPKMVTVLQPLPTAHQVMRDIEYEQIDPLDGDTWDSLVTTRPDHTVFHRSAWARILTDSYDHRPMYLRITVTGVEAALVPLMEVRSPLTGRRGVSLPFADFCGPLWTLPQQASVVYQVLLALAAIGKWKYLEVRGGPAPELGARSFRTYHTDELDLRPGISQLFQKLHSSTRRSIHKSERSGLTLTIERDPEAMRAFYQLHCRTRRRHGLPPQPSRFFDAIQRHLIEQGMGTIVLAHKDGKAVAGAVFLHSGDRAIYKFGASEKEHWNLSPNHLVMWGAIQYLVRAGFKSLHFGRTSNHDTGLIRFKQSWSATPGNIGYFRFHAGKLDWIANENPSTESLPLVFGHLPLSLNRIAGRLIYPHLD